jgi:hypothetical protein
LIRTRFLKNVDDIEKVLQSKLDEMTGFQESKGDVIRIWKRL